MIFRNDANVEENGQREPTVWDALQHNVQDLPDDVLPFLLPSRYCAVDSDLKEFTGTLVQQCAARLSESASHLQLCLPARLF